MGRRIPTIPFTHGRPMKGYEFDPEDMPKRTEAARRAAMMVERPALPPSAGASTALGAPRVHYVLGLVGSVCFGAGLFVANRWVRAVLVAAGAVAFLTLGQEGLTHKRLRDAGGRDG